MSNVTRLPPPPRGRDPRVLLPMAACPQMRLGTMGAPSDELAFDGRDYWAKMGAVVCRGRLSYTCVLPAMREPVSKAFLDAGYRNDN